VARAVGKDRTMSENLSGKIVDPRGYILIRVGKGHHLADCRGLAYEHRLVAEEKIGRELTPSDFVHHVNGNPSDNRRENLVVVHGIAEHKVFHRREGSHLRLPGEENPEINCACGCGRSFNKYDTYGRPRLFSRCCSSSKGTGKRNSGEMTTCSCGCGEVFSKYDSGGRIRKYKSGHNSRVDHPNKRD
jgi:hypothetical protein